jgi:uncharacterized protein (TIRG00374 family)
MSRHRLALIASAVVLAGCGWLMHAGALPIVPPRRAFERVQWWTVAVYLAFWFATHWLRCARWYWLLRPLHPVSMRQTVAVSFVGYGALLILPLRLGEAVRPAMIRRKGELSAWAAASTVVADRIIDGLFFAILLFSALRIAKPLSPLPDHIGKLPVPAGIVPVAAYAAVLVFAAAFAVTALFYWRRAFALELTRAVLGRVSPRLASRAAAVVERLADGFSFLPRARYTLPFLGVTAASWAFNIVGQWLLMRGCGFEAITVAQVTVIACVLALGILAPNAPGFFGAFQISAYAGLALYLPPAQVVGQGSAFVFLLYVSQVGVTLVAAVLALIVGRFTIAQVLQAGSES